MDSIGIVVSILSTSAATAVVMALLNRRAIRADIRKTNTQTEQIEDTMKQTETVYYQERVEETIKQMRVLETRVKELQTAIEVAREQYERQVGGLYAKVDGLVVALERANKSLDIANETIAQLRQEVKNGNDLIAKLQEKITQLLIDKAEQK